MTDSLNLNTTPLFINASDDAEVDISNGGPGTVYYKTTNTVSASSNDGSIAAGATLRIRTPKWIVSTTQTKVFARRIPHREDTINVHGIPDMSALTVIQGAPINVKDELYGAAGDGVTDDTAAIQAALDAAEDQGGGRVYAPAGTYNITGTLTFNEFVSFNGDGKRETILELQTAASTLLFNDRDTTGNRGGSVYGFQVQGNNVATECMRIEGTNREFRDLRISTPKGAGGVALKLFSAQNLNLFNVECEDSSHSASRSTYGIVFDGGAAGINLYGTSLNEFTGAAVLFDASVATPVVDASDHSVNVNFNGYMIERSDTSNPLVHIKAGNDICFSNGNLAHNTFTPSAEYSVVVIENTAARSYGAIGGSGSPTRNISFIKPNINGALGASHGSPATTTYATAFEVTSSCSPWMHTLAVDDAHGTNCFACFKVAPTAVGVVGRNIDNHLGSGFLYIDNPAATGRANTQTKGSTTTLTVRPDTDFYNVTGSNTIETLSVTYSGHQVTLLFSGAPTVSSSAGNIKLSGLVDMSATADDVLCLICDGTNWHETSRVVK